MLEAAPLRIFVLEFKFLNSEIWVFWNFGIGGFGYFGSLEVWNLVIWEFGNLGILELQNLGILEFWEFGLVEVWKFGI